MNTMTASRITNLLLPVALLLCQLPACFAGASQGLAGGAPSILVNPLRGLSFPRRNKQQRQRRSSSSSGYHDVLLCNNNNEPDELTEVRSLALSSRDEQAFFTQADHALLQQKSSKSKSVVIECAAASATLPDIRPLVFWENMVCGAISRSIAQTVMHPANTMKTILQSERVPPSISSLLQPKNFRRLSRGAGANFLLSVPHGAVNFAVLEFVRAKMTDVTDKFGINTDRIGPGLDFLSSAISTICCSIVSTPQMMITDNIMAGNYANLPGAVQGLYANQGIAGFYAGWFPGLAGKIPSYALTWTLFQQLKTAHRATFQRDPKDIENSIMGCLAAATTVCIMIPIDTIKTRLVTQASMAAVDPYKGIIDCAMRVYREEGLITFYRGLPPRLVSVVPMIGIQFGVYEYMKRIMVERSTATIPNKQNKKLQMGSPETPGSSFEETTMEVAADNAQPFPAPHLHIYNNKKDAASKQKKKKNQKK